MTTQRPIPVQYVTTQGTTATADLWDVDELGDTDLHLAIDHTTNQTIALRLNDQVWEQQPLTRH